MQNVIFFLFVSSFLLQRLAGSPKLLKYRKGCFLCSLNGRCDARRRNGSFSHLGYSSYFSSCIGGFWKFIKPVAHHQFKHTEASQWLDDLQKIFEGWRADSRWTDVSAPPVGPHTISSLPITGCKGRSGPKDCQGKAYKRIMVRSVLSWRKLYAVRREDPAILTKWCEAVSSGVCHQGPQREESETNA